MKQINGLWILIIVLIVLTPLVTSLEIANLSYRNGTMPDYVDYDRLGNTISGNTYGTDSYIDHSPSTPNLFLHLCYDNLSVGDKIDLVYKTEGEAYVGSLLYFLPTITDITDYGTHECTWVDIDLAAGRALYPGYVSPVIVPTNASYDGEYGNNSNITIFNRTETWLNGSYSVGVDVEGPPKIYLIKPSIIRANDGLDITRTERLLLTSLVNESNGSIVEEKLDPSGALLYDGELKRNYAVYVNGLRSLDILDYRPCDPINEPGYYVMNESKWNYNDTCVILNDTRDLVLNFGDEIIDGDENQVGILDRCSVIVQDSVNVTLENLRVQDYYYGLCVINSTVEIYGSGVHANFNGAKVIGDSYARFVDISLSNNDSEIISFDDSIVDLEYVNLSTALLKATFRASRAKAVYDRPEPLPIEGLIDIDQFIQFDKETNNAFAQLNFHYEEPLPNDAVTDNISIFKYDEGVSSSYNITMVNETDNTTYNVTVTTSSNGTWSQVYTLVSPSEGLIIGPNMTNYSIFAPHAQEGSPQNVTEPEPDPDPDPQAGAGGGSGGTPIDADVDDDLLSGEEGAIFLELTLPENITLMQGEIGEIHYNLSNNDSAAVGPIIVAPEPRRGWDSANDTVLYLRSGQKVNGTVLLSPYEKELPGEYLVPVSLFLTDTNGREKRLLSETIRVIVKPRALLNRLKILEYPPEILFKPLSNVDVSFLAENIGDFNLTDITAIIDDSACVRGINGQSTSFEIGEIKELDYTFTFGTGSDCTGTVRFYSGNELVGFLPLQFKKESGGLDIIMGSTGFTILIALLLLWTIIAFLVIERRAKRRR